MRITCPNCTAGFEIPTELLGRKGRSLKCATCGHSWFQAAIIEEVDLADVLAEPEPKPKEPKKEAARETATDMGGASGGRRAPDTAAIAAAANEAIGKPTDPSIPPPTPAGGMGTAGGPVPKPPSDVPEGAKSLLGHRKNQAPKLPGEATSMMEDGAIGGPQAAAMEGTSLKGQAGADAIGDEAQSWFDNADANAVPGASGGPGAAPAGAAASAAPENEPQAGAQGGPGAPPQAPAAVAPNSTNAPEAQGAAQQAPASGAYDGGASGGPGAAPQRAANQPAEPGQSIRDDGSMEAPGDAAVSWLEREPGTAGVPGMPGMPGMPGASSAGAMGGAPGGVSPVVQSMMDRDRAAGPGGAAVSQLTGEQMQAPGMGAQSMLSGDVVVPPGTPPSSMAGEQGTAGGPGVSQMGGGIDAPGDVARSLLDGSEQGVAGAPGSAPEEGTSGGPGQSMLGDDESGGGAEGGPESGGASGGPGGAPSGASEDDDAFFQGEKGSADGDLEEDPLGEEDDDAFFQGERGADDDDEDEEGDATNGEDDDAFFQSKKSDGEDEELIDPDEDRPDFGGVSGDGEDDDLDDDPLADLVPEDGEKPEKKQKKKSKPLDPAYVTAAVLSVIVLLIGSLLFAARDQLTELWPGIEGVYEALNLEDEAEEGLRLSAPQPVRIMKGGVQTLVVTGFVTNLTEELKNVPDIKLMLIDKDNNVVQETTSPPSSPTIDPNSTAPYRIELQLPVESATSLQVDWN